MNPIMQQPWVLCQRGGSKQVFFEKKEPKNSYSVLVAQIQ
jgi:hypothetical protein